MSSPSDWGGLHSRRALLAAGLACALPVRAKEGRTLSMAAYPLVDEIIKDALPQWRRLHPDVELQVVSRQYVDHHTAMTTALSTSVYLPDVMALEASYVGRFASGSATSMWSPHSGLWPEAW